LNITQYYTSEAGPRICSINSKIYCINHQEHWGVELEGGEVRRANKVPILPAVTGQGWTAKRTEV